MKLSDDSFLLAPGFAHVCTCHLRSDLVVCMCETLKRPSSVQAENRWIRGRPRYEEKKIDSAKSLETSQVLSVSFFAPGDHLHLCREAQGVGAFGMAGHLLKAHGVEEV